MNELEIIQIGNPVLRQESLALTKEQLKGKDIKNLIKDMKKTLREEEGLGLAANQVDRALQIIAVSIPPELMGNEQAGIPLQVLINPRIVSHSEETKKDWEGCLSIKPFVGLVPRHRQVVVEAWDEKGEKITIEAYDLFARVLQHEIDHINGTLFVDRMEDLHTLMNEEEFKKLGEEMIIE